MKLFLTLSALLGSALASPLAKSYAANYGYNYDPNVAQLTPVTSSQFHAQDELGQYNYGYTGPTSSKVESKTADGVTRGSYSYIDANGQLQQVNYVSDILGFRTVGTNIPGGSAPVVAAPVVAPVAPAVSVPQETIGYTEPLVKAVPASRLQVHPTRPAKPFVSAVAPTVAYSYLPYATQYAYFLQPAVGPVAPTNPAPVAEVQVAAAPTPVIAAQPQQYIAQSPVPQVGQESVPQPAGVTQYKFHAQDEFGQYQYGYADPNSAHTQTKTADGTVTGAYNYIDDQGQLQTVQYIADAGGFRVAGTNFPVDTNAPAAPIADTPEVTAAKIEHARLVAEIRERDAALRTIADLNSQQGSERVGPLLVPARPLAEVQAEIAAAEAANAGPVVVDRAQAVIIQSDEAPAVPALPIAPVNPIRPVIPAEQVPASIAADIIEAPVEQISNVAPAAVPGSVPTVRAGPLAIPVSSQYHAQDEEGQYSYGYSNPLSSKTETKTADGVTRGAYSYIDANGEVQQVQYISDALGFRVAGTNIPVDKNHPPTPQTPVVNYSYLPYAVNYQYLLPAGATSLTAADTVTPVAAPAPQTVVQTSVNVPSEPSSQYHAQDETGQYNYGYSNQNSAKVETKTADGVVRGSYSYVDANGELQTVEYISDALGFRAAGTNIPVDSNTPVLSPSVTYSHLPYAVNHPYYF